MKRLQKLKPKVKIQNNLNTLYDMDPEAIFNGKFIRASNGNADSLNILGASVKKIGEMMDKEKQELDNHQMVSKMVNGLPPEKDILTYAGM